MKRYLIILPVSILVTYSQIVVKWRSGLASIEGGDILSRRIINLLIDPVIISAYFAAFVASFAWLYVVTKLPLTIAFPVYVGITFVMVLFSGWFFLRENLTVMKLVAIVLILSGIIVGISADA